IVDLIVPVFLIFIIRHINSLPIAPRLGASLLRNLLEVGYIKLSFSIYISITETEAINAIFSHIRK
ncbi:MAG: hypothetical protein ACYSW3_30495, partial [Planctomycetota bacterium]